MSYKPVSGETEFGGVDGMFPAQQRGVPSLQQEMWATYAANEGGGVDAEVGDTSSADWGADHIGEPRESFSIKEPTPDLTNVPPWNGEVEAE